MSSIVCSSCRKRLEKLTKIFMIIKDKFCQTLNVSNTKNKIRIVKKSIFRHYFAAKNQLSDETLAKFVIKDTSSSVCFIQF